MAGHASRCCGRGRDFRQEPLPFNLVGHLPAQVPPSLTADTLAEQGRFLFEEASCIRCHRPEEKGPRRSRSCAGGRADLSKIGGRAHAGWMARWLQSPQKMRPGAAMPELFGHDEGGRAECYAVARYLATLGGPVKPAAKQPKPQELLTSGIRGQKLFNSVGCVISNT